MLVPLAGVLTTGCMGDWDREPETPRAAWEEYPGESTVASTPPPAAAVNYNDVDDTDPSALVTFQSSLAPYGTWYDDPYYGTVWYPNQVDANFSPYLTNGRWSYTSEGYYWNSDNAWGTTTFHYGRWVWVDTRGWVWIPGARYAPAWVDWRYGSGYMGWGPAYPRHCWRGGSAVYIDMRPVPYVFLPSGSFFHGSPSTVVVAPSAAPGLVASTQPYTPAAPIVGAKPFVGPDPKLASIPPSDVAKATIPAPSKGKPETIAWTPAPSSKLAPSPGDKMISPPNAGTLAPGAKGSNLPPPSYASKGYQPSPMAGGKSVTIPGNGYGPNAPTATAPKWNGNSPYSPKPYNPPAYNTPPPTAYNPSPGYGPKPYSPPPNTYSPPPNSYSPPPNSYSPPPAYHPPPAYNPPPSYGGGYGGGGGYAPAPKQYSPPAPNYGGGGGGFGGGGGYSPAPKAYSPPPSFGGGGGGFGGGGGGGGFGGGGGGFSPKSSSKPMMAPIPGK